MGLPQRPDVIVRVPAAIYVGERVVIDIEVEVEPEKKLKLEFIDVRITGTQGWRIGSSSSSSGSQINFPRLEKRVMGEGVLPEGKHHFSVAFTLPPGTAPSHSVYPASARVRLDVHASIPWWPDGRYQFDLPVRMPPPSHVERTPSIVREPFHAASDQPRIEIALASTTLVAGETIAGSLAVFHMNDKHPRDVEVGFEPLLRLHTSGRTYDQWSRGYYSTVTLPAGSSGTAVPFKIRLPEAMPPTFASVTHELAWFMSVTVGSLLRAKVNARVPLTILDTRAADSLPKLTLVPRVADQRVLATFDAFARHHGLLLLRDEDDDYPGEQPTLVRELENGRLRVGYSYRGKDGTFLVGRLEYRSLGLGLRVTPSTPLRELVSDDLEIDLSEWDRVHRVAARDATQTVPFLRKLVPLPQLGTLVRWTDDELVFEQAVAQVEPPAIAHIVNGLDAFADKLAETAGTVEPPTGLGVDLPAWQALAQRYDASLCRGDLSFTGRMDTVPVEVRLEFSSGGRPHATRAWLGGPESTALRGRAVSLRLAHPAVDARLLTSERLAAQVATWSSDIIDLRVENGVVSAALPITAGGVDADRIRELVRTLRELLANLDESAGPYR